MRRGDASKAELRHAIQEMIKASHCFMRLLSDDARSRGIYKTYTQRLAHLENQLRGKRQKPLSYERSRSIGHELARVVGELCKSLIHYLWSCLRECRFQTSLWLVKFAR